MRIVAYVNKDSGVGYHRILMPLLLMKDVDVFVTNNLLEEHFDKGCDIFLYNRILPDHAMPGIKALQQKHGFKIALDIDDYWYLDPHHVLFQEYLSSDFARQQVEHIRNADILFTTHERLYYEIKAINPNVHICPNAIPHQGQFAINSEPSDLIRIFWQGSDTHKEDIKLLFDPIKKLSDIAPKIKMIMSGWAENDEWHSMASVYTSGFNHQYKIIPFRPAKDYYAPYAEADICVVPLLNTRFNRMKSNLKVLEAANMGLPVIASDVHPYKGLPIYYCNSTGDWVRHISKLVKSSKRREEAGARLKEFCDNHFNFHKINNERKEILEYESKKSIA